MKTLNLKLGLLPRVLSLAGLLLLNWGCAALRPVSSRAPIPTPPIAQGSWSDRVAIYQNDRVEYVDGLDASIHGNLYSPRAMTHYYALGGAEEAESLERQSISERTFGIVALCVAPAIGCVVGLGILNDQSNDNGEYGSYQAPNDTPTYVAMGSGLLCGVLISIYEHYHSKADQERAAELFNQGLLGHLGLRPASRGAGLSISY